ncbi:hypothetical protein Q1695_015536 [Nippostrongylus brasiliensis]|nr:hypothetical protein Q1695_015536 [Nippostrongylus brasiliensis]
MDISNQSSCSRNMVLEEAEAVECPERTAGAQTNAKQVRSVQGEMKAKMNPRPRKSSEEIEKMDKSSEKDAIGDEKPRSDWSTLRAALEAAFGSIGRSTTNGSS